MTSTWVYSLVDLRFLRGGFCDFAIDSVTEGRTTFPDAVSVDLRLDRFDPVLGKRLATQTELTDAALADADAAADIAARQKDLLAMCATTLERFDPAWATMTNAQRKTSVNALATRWGQWRRWVERNNL